MQTVASPIFRVRGIDRESRLKVGGHNSLLDPRLKRGGHLGVTLSQAYCDTVTGWLP